MTILEPIQKATLCIESGTVFLHQMIIEFDFLIRVDSTYIETNGESAVTQIALAAHAA